MKTGLTQKELLRLCWKHGLHLYPRMPKNQIMLFITAAIEGDNSKFKPVADELLKIEMVNIRAKKLELLLGV